MDRVTFSPGEFAELFGKSQTWGYRQIYAGKVKTITEYGRILIPAAEVDRILASAGRYNGLKKKPSRTKAEIQALKPELKSAWSEFLAKSRARGSKPEKKGSSRLRTSTDTPNMRRAAIDRLVRREDGSGRSL